MTPTQVKTLLELGVLQAYAEGKEIQVSSKYDPWKDYVGNTPDFANDHWNWRVKPESKTGWINIFKDTDGHIMTGNTFFPTKEAADRADIRLITNTDRIACIQISYIEREGL